jgi:DNA invertase Pin-like site-specific DNA recombinase
VRAIAYTRVSTERQATSQLGLEAQRAILEADIARRGWEPVWLSDEGASARTIYRPALTEALRMLAAGEAGALVVAKLDRLTRSLADSAGLLERAKREGWTLVVLDIGADTSTPAGRMVAGVLASAAQYQRELTALNTTEALAAAKAKGRRLGRRVALPQSVRERIAAERARGDSLPQIAGRLTEEGVPTAQGGQRWHASTVAAVLRSVELDAEAEAALAAAG